MKKNVLNSVIIASFVLVLFFGVDVGSGCACISQRDMVRSGIFEVRKIIEKEKEGHGVYPTYEELQKMITQFQINKYDEKKVSSEGLFYALSQDKSEYTLKGYVSVTFFGMQLPFAQEVKI